MKPIQKPNNLDKELLKKKKIKGTANIKHTFALRVENPINETNNKKMNPTCLTLIAILSSELIQFGFASNLKT